jgi:hypothetical protein
LAPEFATQSKAKNIMKTDYTALEQGFWGFGVLGGLKFNFKLIKSI